MVDRSSARSRADVYRRCAEKMEEGTALLFFQKEVFLMTLLLFWMNLKMEHLHFLPNTISYCRFYFHWFKRNFPFDNSKGYPGK
jgi:1-acyl-sn-glycerol-3-phosphate acyltransferase